MTHPETDKLIAFSSNPQSGEFKNISLHLATCESCRSELNLLSAIHANGHELEYNSGTNKSIKNEQIEQYVEGLLSEEETEQIEALIKDNPQALKRTLHYATHSSAMNRGLQNLDEPTPIAEPKITTETSDETSFFDSFKNFLYPPVWISAPVTAVTVAVLFFVMSPTFQLQSSKMVIASYQDNAVITFMEKKQSPGIGFFSKANKTTQPFGTVDVKLVDEKTVIISWPAIEKAQSYTIALQMFDKGDKIKVAEKTTINNNIEIRELNISSNQRYVWEISGNTRAGKTFRTTGGFVIK